MDKELILDVIEWHINEDLPRLRALHGYYKGGHEILNRPERPDKPNNRLVASHPTKIVDTATAYFIGQPITMLDDDLDVQEELNNTLKENTFDDTLLEIAKECSICGKSGMLIYQNEQSETKIMRIPATECVRIVDRQNLKEATARVYQYYVRDDKGNKHEYIAVEIYTDTTIDYYTLANGKLTPDTRYENSSLTHVFGACPLIIFENNEELLGDFERVITLIDAYDKLMSDTSNEHEAYRNAYLMLKNLMMDTESAQAIQQGGTIEVGEDGDAKFITKTIQDTAITAHLDRLQNDIHNFTDVPNMSDESFAGNSSGVALKYKLMGLENKCIIKESKFKKALVQFCKCLNPVIKLKIGKEINIGLLKIQFVRNMPQNLTELADLVVKLDGIVDKETLLSLLPFIENPQVILEKLEEETELFGFNSPNIDDEEDIEGDVVA